MFQKPRLKNPSPVRLFVPHDHAPRLALQAEDVHRAERQVHADDHQPEVPLAERLVEQLAEHLRPPVVEAGEDAEDRATEQHVVEVGDDVVRVGLLGVARRHRVGDAGEAADGELDDHADGEQHRRREAQLAAPHRERPVDDLHARGDGDQHRRHREHGDADRAEAAGEHVVGPHAPAHEADGRAGEDDELVAEQRLAG